MGGESKKKKKRKKIGTIIWMNKVKIEKERIEWLREREIQLWKMQKKLIKICTCSKRPISQ